MSADIKPDVPAEDTFDKLDIRVGRVLSAEPAPDARRSSYIIEADFGRFGVKRSVARLTRHDPVELVGKQILGVLNIGARDVGGYRSEFLCLGVQIPKAESGEATIITPLVEVKLGSKLF